MSAEVIPFPGARRERLEQPTVAPTPSVGGVVYVSREGGRGVFAVEHRRRDGVTVQLGLAWTRPEAEDLARQKAADLGAEVVTL